MTDQNQRPKGFAGLEEMASEVDIPEPIKRPAKIAPDSQPSTTTATHRPFEVDDSVLRDSGKKKGMSSQKKWGIGIAVVVVLVVIGNLDNKGGSGGYTAPANVESMPAPGSGQLLGDNQIRYCLSQDIRLSSWGTVVDHYSQTAIDSFNAAVGDYNLRCSSYKYKRGAVERVRAEVETRRASLQSDGALQASIYR
jgi:hypothetical protein